MEAKSGNYSATIDAIVEPHLVEQEWRQLASNCDASYFLDWGWIGPWADMVVKQTDLYLYRCFYNDELVAICFLTFCNVKRSRGFFQARQVHINEFVSSDHDMASQYNGLMALPEYQQSAWRELISALTQSTIPWDEIYTSSLIEKEFEQLSAVIPSQLNKFVDYQHLIWKVELNQELANEANLLAQFKRKSRQQLRQSLKAITETYGEIQVTLANDLEQALVFFEKMEVLHTSRWQKVGEQGVFENNLWQQFHREIISLGFDKKEVLFFEVKAGEQVLGYLYGHVKNGTALMQQTGFITTSNNRLRPGYVSHFHCMLKVAEMGLRCYDFLPDRESSYKRFFCQPSGTVHCLRLQKPRVKFGIENKIRQAIKKRRTAKA